MRDGPVDGQPLLIKRLPCSIEEGASTFMRQARADALRRCQQTDNEPALAQGATANRIQQGAAAGRNDKTALCRQVVADAAFERAEAILPFLGKELRDRLASPAL